MNLRNLWSGLILASAVLLMAPAHAAMDTKSAQQLVQPFYDMLSQKGGEATVAKVRKVFADDWRSYFDNGNSKGREETIKAVGGFGQMIPNLNWEIKEVLVSGDRIIVRGEATGTPAGDFFGVPHTGRSFKIMSIDIHQVSGGKVVRSYHIEDWAGAIRQLTAK